MAYVPRAAVGARTAQAIQDVFSGEREQAGILE